MQYLSHSRLSITVVITISSFGCFSYKIISVNSSTNVQMDSTILQEQTENIPQIAEELSCCIKLFKLIFKSTFKMKEGMPNKTVSILV